MLLDRKVVTPKELGLEFDVEETGDTFFDNALLKAKALYELCGLPAMADDSGLCVDALGGGPGVYSARYSGGGDSENIDKLLATLGDRADRAAKFVCCIVYYDGKNTVCAEGETVGHITMARDGEGGFGYDPVFFSYDLNKTFGVAAESEKNAVSHRARALRAMVEKLKSLGLEE